MYDVVKECMMWSVVLNGGQGMYDVVKECMMWPVVVSGGQYYNVNGQLE